MTPRIPQAQVFDRWNVAQLRPTILISRDPIIYKGPLLAWTIALVSRVTIEPLGADQDLAKDLSKMLAEQKTLNQPSE